jgi:hypothetical protein
LLGFFGFSVCIFWASWWRCTVVVLGECCVGGVGVWGLRVGWCSAGWVFGHGVVIWRFFFQSPTFNVAFHWSSVGFWAFSTVSVEHMTMFNVPFRNCTKLENYRNIIVLYT